MQKHTVCVIMEQMTELFSLQPYRNRRICVALSGGRDSVALLHYFLKNAAAYSISLSALTCEHGIRGENSIRDMEFVKRLCQEWQVPLRVFRFDVPSYAHAHREGIEEAARRLRYECFARVTAEEGKSVATAHHQDDYAETVLFRLCRGTALGGLRAFPEREGILRPMLFVPRVQIDAYVCEHALPFVEDETNEESVYARNFLRNEIFPVLEGKFPAVSRNLVRFAQYAAEDDDYLNALALDRLRTENGEYFIPVNLPDPLFFRACLQALQKLGLRSDYTSANLEEVARLRFLQSGRKASLPGGLSAMREGEEISVFSPSSSSEEVVPFRMGTLSLGGYRVEIGEGPSEGGLRVDLDKFPQTCVLRTRREGDLFTPFHGSERTLKKFLTDRKISARQGRMLPLVAYGNRILVVCGVEISDEVKVGPDTERPGYLLSLRK